MPRQIHEFNVAMTCEGCSGAVERVLGKLKGQGVEKVEINLPSQQVLVHSDLSHDVILENIKKTGKAVTYVGSKDA
ncbi:copper transport protein ATOX1 [Ischnura elegans]|uniref:copper transport protein ATOX1 n=1 Tax=Ischnura elegans TaxID=197161 RepID=UPI001ED86FAF|nr:copper transport protein ATOX1 [Ischnura elegans]